jgi:hypothetical protein
MADLGSMNIKIGADLSGLENAINKGVTNVSNKLAEVAASAAKVDSSFSKSENAAMSLAASLEKMGNEAKARIQVIADAALKANAPINTLAESVKKFGGGVINTRIPEYFQKIREEADKATKVLPNVVPGANQAGNALMNLGRVAQDAPFGFIGIQNNINPLLESFQRLKAETGSTKTALSALAGSLAGAGGLGLAVSLGTSLLTVLAQNGFFKTAEAADEAKKKTDEFKKSVEGIFSNAAKEAVEVGSLITVLQSETATRERKLAVLKELKSINPEIFSQLKLEGATVAGLDAAYQGYIKNLRTVIAVKIKQQQLEKITQQILENEGVTLTKSQQQAVDVLKKYNKERQNQVQDGQLITVGTVKQVELEKKQSQLYKDQAEILTQLIELQKGVHVEPIKEKDVQKGKTYKDILADLLKELTAIDGLQELGRLTPKDADVDRVKAYTNAIEELFKINAKSTAAELTIPLQEIDFRVAIRTIHEAVEKIKKEVNKTEIEILIAPKPVIDKSYNGQNEIVRVSQLARGQVLQELKELGVDKIRTKQGILVPISFATINDEELKAALANKLQQIEEIGNAIQTTLGGAFQSTFETIASGGQDALGVFSSAIRQVIVKLISAAATAAVLAGIIGLATGGASFAKAGGFLGSMKSLFSQLAGLPKFAAGVTNFRGGWAMVGERGPELVNLPSGSSVIPNHSLGGLGGGSQVFIPEMVIRGNDLLILFERATAAKNRIG